MNQILSLAYNLLKELNIKTVYEYKDHLEIRYYKDNQAIIAYGKNDKELIENFYELYQELYNPELQRL